MSLHLLSAIKSFRIRHCPDEVLKLRIGIHSGMYSYCQDNVDERYFTLKLFFYVNIGYYYY